MRLRKMSYNEADLTWLREARHTLYALNSKQMELQTEQNQLTADINQRFKVKYAKKEKGKKKESQAEASETATASDEDTNQEPKVADSQLEEINKLRERARKIREELETVQKEQEEIRLRSLQIRLSWPNHCHPDVPLGPEENAVLVAV